MIGTIFDIKEMAVHDGPGIRTTVFFKGCPLKCQWCHNPEGLSFEPQIMYKKSRCIDCKQCYIDCQHPECKSLGRCIYVCPENCLEITGKKISADELAKQLIQTAEVLGNSFGGFTFSGGEPLAQPDFLFELIEQLNGYHLCIETSGYSNSDIFEKVINKLDFIILDIKIADAILHQQYTGVNNQKILENFELLRKSGKPYIIRTPLIPSITDTKSNLNAIKNIIGDCNWEKIPFNAAAGAKYKMLGIEWKL